MSRVGHDCQAGAWQQCLHAFGDQPIARVVRADDQLYGPVDLRQARPERRLLAGAHAAQAVGQAKRGVLQTLSVLRLAHGLGTLCGGLEQWLAFPFGDECGDAHAYDTIGQRVVRLGTLLALGVVFEPRRRAFQNEPAHSR